MENLLRTWALKYVEAGWSLIPICTKDKKPLIPWQEFQMRRADMKEIESWVTRWPDMNLGVVTGNISKIVVVDLDGLEGKKYGLQTQIVSCLTSLTGNGKQVFYKWTEHVDNSVSKLAPGVDIRGDGGYVVVPPSIHPNGKRYRWERFIPKELKVLPNNIAAAKANHLNCIQHEDEHICTFEKKESGWIAKALEEMKIGNIDDTLTSILGRLRRDGYSSIDAFTLLNPHANAAGAENGHLEEKIKNIWSRYEPKQLGLQQGMCTSSTSGNELSIHSPADDDSFNRFKSVLESTTKSKGLQTGFPTLDKYFEGGLKSERLFTVAALPNHGKTNFAIALSINLCQQGKKVLYFSTEYRYQKIWTRYIAALNQPERFREHPFFVVDSYSPNLSQVEEAIKQIKPDVFIFDYIQHISKEKEAITAFMRGCQFLQRQYEVQGIILAQIGRKGDWVENGKRIEPRMSMIEGCSTIEQASSRVLLLSETHVSPEKNEIVGVLDKNDTGDKGLINLALYKHPYRMAEL